MPTWVGSPEEVLTGSKAALKLKQTNDSQYYTEELGVVKVDIHRWIQAQQYECRGWTKCWSDNRSDRNAEHAFGFKNYESLPQHLGQVLEIGCGPFTQTQTILEFKTADHITLLDPLIDYYLGLTHCPYKHGHLKSIPVHMIARMAECLEITEGFDTVVCINVLEHVMDAIQVLHNLYQALRSGGCVVLGERSFDAFNPLDSYDVGHPIAIRSTLFESFYARFEFVFVNGKYFIGRKR